MTLENSGMKQTCKDNGDFTIVDGILVEYLGNGKLECFKQAFARIHQHGITNVFRIVV